MKKEIIEPANVARPAAPYASAIRVSGVGSLVFVSGVVKTTTYVVNGAMKDFFATRAFLEALTPFKTADTLVGVAALAGSDQGQLIEIDAIAVAGA